MDRRVAEHAQAKQPRIPGFPSGHAGLQWGSPGDLRVGCPDWQVVWVQSVSMRVWTANSLYELDLDASRIRRVLGQEPPTSRQGDDGQWRRFEGISQVRVGDRMLIVWSREGEKARSTLTSTVVEITES